MKLLELSIRRLPGIDRPFVLGPELLGDGVHVVHGPNGIGKSSLLRALRALWWPSGAQAGGLELAARFEHAGHTWRVEREGVSVRWQRDGEPSEAPELPDEELASCLLVRLDDLASTGDAAWFTKRVELAFTGDYDLRGARERLFTLKTQHGQREAQAWEQARARRAELERSQRALFEEERELQELEAAIARSTAAQAELARLEVARELEAARAEERGVSLRIAAYPEGMARLPADAAEVLEQLEQRIDALRAACVRRERERAELEDVQARTGLREPIDPNGLDEARERLDSLRRLEGELTAAAPQLAELEGREAAAGAAPEDAQAPEVLRTGANALRAWLVAPEPERPAPTRWLPHLVAAVAAVVLGLQVHPAWFALLLPVLVDLALRGRRPDASSARAAWREQFERTGLDAPGRWDAAGVGLRLEELERRAFEAERRAHAGVGDLLGARARVAELEARRDEAADRIGAWLADHGLEPGADGIALGRALAGLEARSRELETARERARSVERELEERRAELESAERSRAALFERVGLRPDQRAELERVLESRAEWSRLVARRDGLAEVVGGLEARLASVGGALEVAPEELETRIAAARAEAAGRDEHLTRSTEIRTRLAAAARGRELEDARAREAEAQYELAQAWGTACSKRVGQLLVEDVEREHAVTTRPALLEGAREAFARFTRGRYLLDVRDREGSFALVAEDPAGDGATLDPAELSDGTRAQLLLAVRAAYLEHVERGAELPLFLDDVLATSDAERTRCVAEGLFEIAARDGRQVFVLVRDESDARLIAACGDGARRIDLAQVRGAQAAVHDRGRLALPARREVPAPDGLDAHEWAARLGVPAPDPWRGTAHAHLFWLLLERRELLHRILSWGVEDLGRLRALGEAGAAGFLTAEDVEHVEAEARLFDALRRGWLVGRGRPLTRDALERADGVTATFLDRLDELAIELGRDAKRLLVAIEAREDARTKGFRRQSLEALRESLERSGHLDPREALDERGAWDQLLADLPEARERDPLELRRRFEFLRARFDEVLPA